MLESDAEFLERFNRQIRIAMGEEKLTELEVLLGLLKDHWSDDKFDEIEARPMAYIKGHPYSRHDRQPGTNALRVWTGIGEPTLVPPLLTSRDALKAVWPAGWWVHEIFLPPLRR